jgi:diguanylate cyclase (GGDEF)-like protein/PAS domain S-box-containing protein
MVVEVIKALLFDLLLYGAVIAAFNHVNRWTSGLSQIRRQCLLGTVLGSAALIGVLTATEIAPGQYLDARSIIVAISAPFAGLPGMLVTMAMVAAGRLYMSGSASFLGLASTGLVGLAGYGLVRWADWRSRSLTTRDLFLLAAAVIAIGLVFQLAAGYSDSAWLLEVTVPVALAKAVGIPLLGALLLDQRRRDAVVRELDESERRRQAMAANLPGAVYRRVLTPQGALVYEYVSEGVFDIFGFSPEEAVSNPHAIFDMIVSHYRKDFIVAMESSAANLTPWSMDYCIERADGEERWLRDRAIPTRRDDGAIVWDGVAMDMTDQKQAEAELREANFNLQIAEGERDKLIEELRRLSDTDPLTGALNRRGLSAAAEHELKRAKRTGEPVAVIALDLDHFKRVNDTYGHDAGDKVLQESAQLCRAAIREVDSFARLGGEEFVILLQDADEDGAWLVATRLRAALEQTDIAIGDTTIRVTASIGIAASRGADATLADMLRSADEAVYEAKTSGRNRVVRGRAHIPSEELPASCDAA